MRFIFILTFLWAAHAQETLDREVHGRIVDTNGTAIANAMVTVHAVTRATGTRYGINNDVDKSARSSPSGEFVIRGSNPFISITITVDAPGFARGVFPQLTVGENVHELKMLKGASIVGRLLKNGQPLPAVKLGISDSERGSEIYLLNVTTETDANGRFQFTNIPPRRSYFLYGVMNSLRDLGALTSRRINVGANGSNLDVGELSLEPAVSVGGRIDLKSVPAKTKVTLGRDGPRDTQTMEADNEGRFRFTGAPLEVVSITADVPGHRLSAQNASLFPPFPNRLLGRVTTNKDDLILRFEPGAALEPFNANPFLAREEILRGIERSNPFPGSMQIAGKVPGIDQFSVTEGRFIGPQSEWFTNRTQVFTNGSFNVYMAKTENPAALRIEANGYLPNTIIASSDTNITVELKKGGAISGVVIGANGQPVANASVYLVDTNNSVNLEGLPLQLVPFQNEATRQTQTDSNGRFSFPARSGDSFVTAFGDAGFANVLLNTNRPIQLLPWARVEGTLRIGGQPGSNELIRLTSLPPPYQWYPREFPPYSISLRTRADTNGHFVFERVPALMMEVAYSPMITDKAPDPIEKTQNRRLNLKPGETTQVELGGRGRPVIGRILVAGFNGTIAWNNPAIFLETISTNAPSDSAITNLLAKLESTARGTDEEKAKAEADYQRERRSFALANQKYYETETGLADLLAERRYLLQFTEGGVFHADDVPPGRYRIRGAISTGRRIIAVIDQEVNIPPGDAREPFDLGLIKLPSLPGK